MKKDVPSPQGFRGLVHLENTSLQRKANDPRLELHREPPLGEPAWLKVTNASSFWFLFTSLIMFWSHDTGWPPQRGWKSLTASVQQGKMMTMMMALIYWLLNPYSVLFSHGWETFPGGCLSFYKTIKSLLKIVMVDMFFVPLRYGVWLGGSTRRRRFPHADSHHILGCLSILGISQITQLLPPSTHTVIKTQMLQGWKMLKCWGIFHDGWMNISKDCMWVTIFWTVFQLSKIRFEKSLCY